MIQENLRVSFVVCFLLIQSGVVASQTSEDHRLEEPRFKDEHTLIRPEGYREWIFVGSSLGLRYSKSAEKIPFGTKRYHNVYINPPAYREFLQSGTFPDGTVMILELASAEEKQEPGLQGSYQNNYVGLEASVKDRKRFQEGWAYFSFDGPGGELKSEAQPFPKEDCWACHHQKAATDHVFTQFYPVLRAAGTQK